MGFYYVSPGKHFEAKRQVISPAVYFMHVYVLIQLNILLYIHLYGSSYPNNVCFPLNIMELDGTQLSVLSAPEIYIWKNSREMSHSRIPFVFFFFFFHFVSTDKLSL